MNDGARTGYAALTMVDKGISGTGERMQSSSLDFAACKAGHSHRLITSRGQNGPSNRQETQHTFPSVSDVSNHPLPKGFGIATLE